MRLTSVLLLALAMVGAAGCLDDAGTPEEVTAPGAVAQASAPATAVLEGCFGPMFVGYVSPEAVDAHLPDGYVAHRQFFGAPVPLNNPHLQVVTCAAVDVGGIRLEGVTFGFSGTLLESPTSAENEGLLFYMFETFLDVEGAGAFATALQSAGWTVTDAEVQLSGNQASIEAEGIAYSFPVPPDPTAIDFDAGPMPFHRVEEAGALQLRIDQQLLGQLVNPTVLQAQGGVYGAFVGEAGTWPGLVQMGGLEGDLGVTPVAAADG